MPVYFPCTLHSKLCSNLVSSGDFLGFSGIKVLVSTPPHSLLLDLCHNPRSTIHNLRTLHLHLLPNTVDYFFKPNKCIIYFFLPNFTKTTTIISTFNCKHYYRKILWTLWYIGHCNNCNILIIVK